MNTLKEIVESVTDEKEKWFEKRTKHHIDLVKKYCQKIYDSDPKRFPNLMKMAQKHDLSKYSEPERDAYVHISWHYKLKRDGEKYEVTPELKKKMYQASSHHVKTNPHHPEHYSNQTEVINKDNRDQAPDKIIDATKMPKEDIAEMVADWAGMSEEVGGTPKEWADKMVNHHWKFTPEQTKLIYELINTVW